MPIRYMGTKRQIAHRVRRLAEGVRPEGKVVDLFSGIGCVTAALEGFRSVITNDALEFSAALARARFSSTPKRSVPIALDSLRPAFRAHARSLYVRFAEQLRAEGRALEGDTASLATYMRRARHAANDLRVAEAASKASKSKSSARYCLASLYYSAGYFGLLQCIHLDALRYAIDRAAGMDEARDWLLAAWLSAASAVANAPGHTAQYLKPNSERASLRIVSAWRRSVWDQFQNALIAIKPVGTAEWRRGNRAHASDALTLLQSNKLRSVGMVYADPPYTRDQYSRYYHVLETLYKYDFPSVEGEARIGPLGDRFSTGFCLRSKVIATFEQLFGAISALGVPLVLSYPSSGLLTDAGGAVRELAKDAFRIEKHESFGAQHSTMGASRGVNSKAATENLYVFRPR